MATSPKFKIHLQVNGTTIESSGATLDAAITALPSFVPVTKGVLTISHGDKTASPVILAIPSLKRLFFPGITGVIQRSMLAKRFTMMV